MEPGTKELMERMKTIFEKEGVTDYIFLEDRIEEKHQRCTPGRDDGSSYRSLELGTYPPAFVRYSRDRECQFFYKDKVIETYETEWNALKAFYLMICNCLICSISSGVFWRSHNELLLLGDKSYHELCEEALEEAFTMLEIPKSHYHFYEEKNEGIVILKKDKYCIQYYNSKGVFIQEKYDVGRYWALSGMFKSTYRLAWWEKFLIRIKEEGEDIFHLEEKDYEKYII